MVVQKRKKIKGNLELKFMHWITTSWVVFIHCRPNNIKIKDWNILFQQNSCLISDLYEVENMAKIAFLNTPGHRKWCENHHLVDKSMIIPLYCFLFGFIDQHTTCFEYLSFFYLAWIKEKYVFINKYLILEYVETNYFPPSNRRNYTYAYRILGPAALGIFVFQLYWQ